jgi:hypothetical protein
VLGAGVLGPFFRLELQPAGSGWQPAEHFCRDGLASALISTADQLGTGETRVAASILQLGLAARLWSPLLGAGLMHGVIPDLSALQVMSGPPVRMGLAEVSGWQARSVAELAQLIAPAVSARLGAFAAALPVRLPAGLLRGNSGSAMAGALGVIARERPDLADGAEALGRELIGTTELAGTGEFTAGLAFRRRSCCLYYRVPGGGLCGDCCHDLPPDSTAQAAGR